MKKFSRVLFEQEGGILEALRLLDESKAPVLSFVSKGFLQVINVGQRIKLFFNPHLKDTGIKSYENNFSQTRQYKISAIRAISWNPHCFKLAVAAVDDSIRIYTNEEQSIVLLLKNGLQKSVTCMAWRPFCSGVLAVGTQYGFLIWTLDPNSCITRPLSQAAHFKHEHHSSTLVTSLEWNPNGTLLATACMNDSSILIWDVDKNACVPLRRTSPPYLNLQWSMNGAYLFTSTVGNVFRVWNCETWKSDRWTIASGHVQSFRWSPCARFLLFVTSEEPILYSLGFADELLFNESHHQVQPSQALPVADLSKISIGGTDVGGIAQQLAWNGRYLAITFKDTDSIAIFATALGKHQLNIMPMFFVSGISFEYATYIAFQPSYKKGNTSDNMLTIGWSSGRIQFLPLS